MQIPLREYWNLLITYISPLKLQFLMLAGLLFTGIALQLINPQIMRSFIDTAMAKDGQPLALLAGAFLLAALLQQVFGVIAVYIGQNIGWSATNRLRFDLTKHLLYLDLTFHNARKPGELIERVDGDINALANFFSQFTIQVVGNLIFLAGVLVLLFMEDWRIGLTLGVFVFVTMVTLLYLRNIGVPHWKEASQAGAEFFGFVEERISGTQDIRANGANAYVMRGFYTLIRTWWKKQLRAALMTNLMINVVFLLMAVGNALAFIVGAALFEDNVITLGTVYLVFHYTAMVMYPIELILDQLEDLQKAGASIIRVKELFEIQSKITDSADLKLPVGALSVQFEDVSFHYEDDEKLVLQHLNFDLKPGKVLGLLGRTGSGKTTVTRLLLRLYDTTDGTIKIGGLPITDSHRVQLRQRIGLVTQNVQLFQGTIRDNLTFFDRNIRDEHILQILRDLGLWPWYTSLSDGLDTLLASGGSGLSAGESQLLAFTRVFLKDPGLVILDEASSRLDPATEAMIEGAIDKLLKNRTAIIIAHRLGTVERADEIMILENGCIGEHGEREQLANDPESHFHHLLKTGLEEVLV